MNEAQEQEYRAPVPPVGWWIVSLGYLPDSAGGEGVGGHKRKEWVDVRTRHTKSYLKSYILGLAG